MEAQEDGVMGKIVVSRLYISRNRMTYGLKHFWEKLLQVQAGAQKIPVGQIIAVLAEEGDDLSSITIPETTSPAAPEQPKQQPKQQPKEEQKAAEQKAREQPRDERRHHEHKEIKHSKPLFPSVSRLCVAIFA